MDNQRLLVWAAFGLMLWITYQAWMQDYGQRPAQPSEAPAPAAGPVESGPELPALAEPSNDESGDEPSDGPGLDLSLIHI